MNLHWTVDYSAYQKGKGDYQAELIDWLGKAYAGSHPPVDAPLLRRTYAILPNFWAGYKPGADGSLSLGRAVITRRRAGSHLDWQVTCDHQTSGEHQQLSFKTADDPHRTLQDGWVIDATNDGEGSYGGTLVTGRCEQAGQDRLIRLTIDESLTVPVGQVDTSAPFTTNWALADIVPEVALAGRMPPAMALLENLQTLKQQVRMARLQDWTLKLPDRKLKLFGAVVHGRGLPPSYWWVDQAGHVVAVSSIFSTLVLAGLEGQQ